jgi:selenocysteine lyase/cysteine desulfurase
MGKKVKVIAIPHMLGGNGTILPIKEICAEAKKRGIFSLIDGAQAVGQISVDVKDLGCDAYFSSMHKWLCAPPGNGMLYIRKERIAEIWTTMASGNWDNHKDEGARFTQRGTGNLALLMGLNAALDFHFRIGSERVHQRIKFLGDTLRAGLKDIPNVQIFTPLHPEMSSGITSYSIKGLAEGRLVDELWNRKKIRIRGIRQCTHIYNSPQEIADTLKIVRDLASE